MHPLIYLLMSARASFLRLINGLHVTCQACTLFLVSVQELGAGEEALMARGLSVRSSVAPRALAERKWRGARSGVLRPVTSCSESPAADK